MRKKDPRTSDPQSGFVWDAGDAVTQEPQQAAGPPRRTPRPRTLLIGSTALVVLAGAAYGVDALSTQSPHDTTGTVALLQPTPAQAGTAAARSALPRPSKSAAKAPSKSASPLKSSAGGLPAVSTAVESSSAAPAIATAPVAAQAQPAASVTLPPAAGDWPLNETTGNTAFDSTGAHDATAIDGWFTGGGFLLNGSNSQAYTDGPVLSTGSGHSFTVSAWVDMTALPVAPAYDETAVSQDGNVNSAFYLQFTEPADRWAFDRPAADSDTSPGAQRALSKNAPSLNTWTHLVGVFNASDGTAQLFVNGSPQGTETDTTPFASSGDLAFGRALYDGKDVDWFKGAIKNVEVFDMALSAAQVASLS